MELVFDIIRFNTAFLITLIASVTDIKHKRIPNELSFIGISVGLLFTTNMYDFWWKVGGVLFIYLFGMLRLMGMGDLKLWMALSCLINFQNSAFVIALAALFLIIAAVINNPKEATSLLSFSIKDLLITKRITVMKQEQYAFAPYIFVALICVTMVLTFIS